MAHGGRLASEVAALAAVRDIVTNVKRNEQEGIIPPAMVDDETKQMVPTVDFKLMSSGGQRAFDTDKIITRYEQRIAMSVLMDFLPSGTPMSAHKRYLCRRLTCGRWLWTRSPVPLPKPSIAMRSRNCSALNGMNLDLCPKLAYSEVGKVDVDGLSTALQRLLTSGAIARTRRWKRRCGKRLVCRRPVTTTMRQPTCPTPKPTRTPETPPVPQPHPTNPEKKRRLRRHREPGTAHHGCCHRSHETVSRFAGG